MGGYNMYNKLLEYGFQEWQINKLIKDRILKTGHGIYRLDPLDILSLNDKVKNYKNGGWEIE